jgi:hypothetical protein
MTTGAITVTSITLDTALVVIIVTTLEMVGVVVVLMMLRTIVTSRILSFIG